VEVRKGGGGRKEVFFFGRVDGFKGWNVGWWKGGKTEEWKCRRCPTGTECTCGLANSVADP
jgi:hypothetical protein